MLWQYINNQRGTSIIETPIAILLLSMLFMYFAGFCYAYYHSTVLDMAVKEGAREYAVQGSVDKAVKRTEAELKLGGIKEGVAVTMDPNTRLLTARKDIGFYVPMAKRYLFHLESSAELRKENDLNYFRKGTD